jgi:hypothetical protein
MLVSSKTARVDATNADMPKQLISVDESVPCQLDVYQIIYVLKCKILEYWST